MSHQPEQNNQPDSTEGSSIPALITLPIITPVNIEMQPIEKKEELIQAKKTPSAIVY